MPDKNWLSQQLENKADKSESIQKIILTKILSESKFMKLTKKVILKSSPI